MTDEFKELFVKEIMASSFFISQNKYNNITEKDIRNFLDSQIGEGCIYYLLNELTGSHTLMEEMKEIEQ